MWAPDLSIVIPVFDEQESLPVLVEKILTVARDHALDLKQVILVDDGSGDGSWSVIQRLAAAHRSVAGVRLRRNFGKATALNVGIGLATGRIIVTMDADLQDDPLDLPRFLGALSAGCDLVSGWKKIRHDPLSKRLSSRLFNFATAHLSGVSLHDFASGFKAYRREVFASVELYGGLHRFVPVLASSLGFRIGELVVQHHPRRFGRSKFGLGRFLHGFIDLLTVLAITRYARSPGHLLGGAGTLLLIFGLGLAGLEILTGADIRIRPLLLLGVLAVILGLQVLFFGVLAELINARARGAAPEALIRDRTAAD
jgi:glycosyltransferase involved in cell wall biosynthesis